MKKLGKKLSFLTKIMLVVGLLISNLSSLSVVFAAEATIWVEVVDEKLNIKYLDELAENVESVRLDIVEKYTYLDDEVYRDVNTNETEFVSSYDLTEEELNMLLSDDEVLVLDSILPNVVFDGIYEVEVELVDTTDESNEAGVLIDTCDYGTVVFHDSGLEVSVIDSSTSNVIEMSTEGKYLVDELNSKVEVVARLLSGGINPTDKFMYNDTPISAMDVLNLTFGGELDFTGRLFGDYIQPVEVEVSKLNENGEYELIEFTDEELNVNLLYGTYELNAQKMNETTLELGLDASYNFASTTQNGVVYVLLDETKVNTMWDLYSIVNSRFSEDINVKYLLSNSEYEDVLSVLNQPVVTEEVAGETVEGENAEGATEEFDLETYLKGIVLDDTAVLSLINNGLTITFKVVVAGDTNNDNKLTNEDLLDLINQVIGEKEVNIEKSDLYGTDEEVNTLDVMKLDQIIKNNNWDIILNNEFETLIDAELKVVEEDIVSGQKFTINYIVKLSDYMINGVSGLFTYDSEAFELNSVDTSNKWLGNSKDGKFLYIGEESLALPEISEPEEDVVLPENSENVQEENTDVIEELVALEETEEIVETEDYVVVSATFIAKKAGTHTINVEKREYFNQDTYYGVEETPVSVEVVVNASDNNNLQSLTVAGQTITLVDGQLDYEITVSNETTVAEVNAIVQNIAANITSIVSPEELVEGENTVMITVVAESGDVKVYTVKVIREAAPEEEEETTTQVNYDNYYNDYDDEGESDGEVIVTEPEEDEEEDDDKTVKEEGSNLSRIVIIILILLVIAGLIYLIFKDEDDEKEETKKVNKEVNKLRKEEKEPEIKKEVKVVSKANSNTNNKTSRNSNKNTKNKKN